MQNCDLLIKDATVLRSSRILEMHKDIAVRNGDIVEVGSGLTEKYGCQNMLQGSNKLFMPGLIDSHMHTGQQLLKGLVLDAKPIIWTRIMLPFESALTPVKMQLSAKLAALEMIKSGTTGFIDAGSYYMEEAADVYIRSGLRGALSYSTMDEQGLPASIAMDAVQALKHTDCLYNNYHGNGNMKVYYSVRALNSCSGHLIKMASDRARERNTMLQAHMNEYQGEIDGIILREGLRPYEYLDKIKALGPHFLGAHSLILSENEKDLLVEHSVKVCHCPFSNCGKAVPETPQLLNRGIKVGMGSDGAAHGGLSLWNEMKIFRSVMNICHGIPRNNPRVMPADTVLRLVLEGGAAALHEDGRLGRLEPGYRADLISIDMNQPHLIPTGSVINTLLECVGSGDVTDMVVGGTVIMKNRHVLTIDEEKILYEAKQYMQGRA